MESDRLFDRTGLADLVGFNDFIAGVMGGSNGDNEPDDPRLRRRSYQSLYLPSFPLPS
jgi:hypothetical protein